LLRDLELAQDPRIFWILDSGLVKGSVVGIPSPADCWSLEVGRLCEPDLISGDFVIDVNIFFVSLLKV
jgi:hypothetical protein